MLTEIPLLVVCLVRVGDDGRYDGVDCELSILLTASDLV